jgi:hypothetical protein
MEDDLANAFLGASITAWSFPAPIPRDMPQAPADKVIGRTMKAKDYAVLRRAVKPLIDEVNDLDRDPKNETKPSAG